MKRPTIKHLLAVTLVACTALGLATTAVRADERIELDQFSFGPLTTRALFPGINLEGPGFKESNWYPVYLVRDPAACYPAFPADHLLVLNLRESDLTNPFYNLGCPLLIEGFGVFETATTPVPHTTNLSADTLPVFFVHKDDVSLWMTWDELTGLVNSGCALQGTADRYREILQSGSPNPIMFPGGAQVPSFNINLAGYLDDGTRFSVHTAGQIVPGPTYPDTVVRSYEVKGLEDKLPPCNGS